jgi:hypothetical protein
LGFSGLRELVSQIQWHEVERSIFLRLIFSHDAIVRELSHEGREILRELLRLDSRESVQAVLTEDSQTFDELLAILCSTNIDAMADTTPLFPFSGTFSEILDSLPNDAQLLARAALTVGLDNFESDDDEPLFKGKKPASAAAPVSASSATQPAASSSTRTPSSSRAPVSSTARPPVLPQPTSSASRPPAPTAPQKPASTASRAPASLDPTYSSSASRGVPASSATRPSSSASRSHTESSDIELVKDLHVPETPVTIKRGPPSKKTVIPDSESEEEAADPILVNMQKEGASKKKKSVADESRSESTSSRPSSIPSEVPSSATATSTEALQDTDEDEISDDGEQTPPASQKPRPSSKGSSSRKS